MSQRNYELASMSTCSNVYENEESSRDRSSSHGKETASVDAVSSPQGSSMTLCPKSLESAAKPPKQAS